MSNALTVEIDVLTLARKALGDEASFNAITRADVVALLGFVLQQNDESIDLLAVQLPDLFARMTAPALPATLAAAIAAAIKAADELAIAKRLATITPHYGRDLSVVEAIEAFNTAFTTLKTRFEKEFPHAGG